MKSVRKHKMHVDLESVHLQPLLSHNSLAECFTKKKNKQHFHHDAANDYSREYKGRWSVKTICMAYGAHPHNTLIIEYMHPKYLATANDDFSLFRHELRHLPSEILDL